MPNPQVDFSKDGGKAIGNCWRVFYLLFLCCFCSCGYQWMTSAGDRTVSVPYITGDEDGSFTAELIRQLCSSGQAEVVSQGRYRLNVAIVQEASDAIGFRRDPQKIKGKIRRHLTENEVRKSISADVSLVEGSSERLVFGPVRVSAYVDCDYVDGDSIQDLQFKDSRKVEHVVLPFSLGQLEPSEAAEEAARRPLYQNLSRKIVDVMMSEW
ncbi:MAG: LPS assembly lipoprotein LptE [Parachlamydia sp.]|nr:LPS assembly lipoprotein LptE [Parachlamydia sp.]